MRSCRSTCRLPARLGEAVEVHPGAPSTRPDRAREHGDRLHQGLAGAARLRDGDETGRGQRRAVENVVEGHRVEIVEEMDPRRLRRNARRRAPRNPRNCASVCPPRLDPPVPRKRDVARVVPEPPGRLPDRGEIFRRPGHVESGRRPDSSSSRRRSSAESTAASDQSSASSATPPSPMVAARARSMDCSRAMERSTRRPKEPDSRGKGVQKGRRVSQGIRRPPRREVLGSRYRSPEDDVS